jgi:hypothetical protein
MQRRHQAIPLQQAAQESPTFSLLMGRVRESSERLQAIRSLLPAPLRAAIQAGPIEDGAWCLLVSSNAVAAKLRVTARADLPTSIEPTFQLTFAVPDNLVVDTAASGSVVSTGNQPQAWSITPPAGITVTPSSGTLAAGATQALTITPTTAGDYSLTLSSRGDGWKDLAGRLLDGNGDGSAGDDYIRTFTVAASDSARLSVGEVAIGPGQAINIPAATGSGLPISLSNAVVTLSSIPTGLSTARFSASSPGVMLSPIVQHVAAFLAIQETHGNQGRNELTFLARPVSRQFNVFC